MPFMI